MGQVLKNSGLPIVRDAALEKLSFEDGLVCASTGTKRARDMVGLLSEYSEAAADEIIYDVYRDIVFAKDKHVFSRDQYRYDITYIMPGTVGQECKKTSGHFHLFNPIHTNTYPEVYEVLEGTAMFVLQRADNFERQEDELVVDDLILVKVEAGQTLLVPANYGHCSVNIGEGPMIFSNLAYVPCGIDYAPVKKNGGMAVFAKKKDGKLFFEKNKKYTRAPMPKFAVVKENPDLGIRFGYPVYASYINRPSAFRFLGRVDEYVDDILSMLSYCGENWAE